MPPTWARVSHTLFQEKGLQESKANTIFGKSISYYRNTCVSTLDATSFENVTIRWNVSKTLSGYMIRGQIPKNEACRTHIGGLGRHTLNPKWIRRALTRGGKLGYESAKVIPPII